MRIDKMRDNARIWEKIDEMLLIVLYNLNLVNMWQQQYGLNNSIDEVAWRMQKDGIQYRREP